MKDETTNLFLSSLIGAVYKVLALNDNDDPYLSEYIDSLCIQLLGGLETFPVLKSCQKYISVINIIQYLRTNEFNKKTCKREILKGTNILEKLSKD